MLCSTIKIKSERSTVQQTNSGLPVRIRKMIYDYVEKNINYTRYDHYEKISAYSTRTFSVTRETPRCLTVMAVVSVPVSFILEH
jgi:hypothetical protein